MKKITFFTAIMLSCIIVFSQGELDDGHKIFFRNEKSYGISLNSNGWGFGYRYGKRIKASNKWLYEGDFNYMKHKKEFNRTNNTSFSRFVYGKTNSVFNLQFLTGRQNELFRKQDRNSVSVRLFMLAGITTAFLKPIYYEIFEDGNIVDKKFTKDIVSHYIFGQSSYYKGFSELSVIPGVIIKSGISFEFSKRDNRLSIIEAGFAIEVYPKTVEIMAVVDNQKIFPLVYLTYRFGRVVSGYHLKKIDEDKNN